jgi:hypothetical protein
VICSEPGEPYCKFGGNTRLGCSLLFNSFYFDSRVTVHRFASASFSSTVVKFSKGEHHHSLGEAVTIPFGKPNFSFIKHDRVLIGTQDYGHLIATEFPLNC